MSLGMSDWTGYTEVTTSAKGFHACGDLLSVWTHIQISPKCSDMSLDISKCTGACLYAWVGVCMSKWVSV